MTGHGGPAASLVVAIDAGGSQTRARALAGRQIVFEGRGGPGNPLATRADELAESYRAALAGCPPPGHVAACVSGTGGERQRAEISALLAARFPQASIRVVPDYVAAWLAAPSGTDAVVIAGTGSLVCSAAPGGGFEVSGGRGWIVGDRGSAARLGQAALEWFCENPGSDPAVAAQVRERLGLTDWRQIVRMLSASPHPAASLARAAPILTWAAAAGADWAVRRLEAEMGALATTARNHIERLPGRAGHAGQADQVRLGLAGGVWASQAARAAFLAALLQRGTAAASIAWPLDPLDGAARLAASTAS